MNHSFWTRVKMLKFSDFVSGLKLLVAIPISLIMRLFEKEIWLICESEKEARDNGYWLFRYICENHPDVNAIYAIEYDSSDYKKVSVLGRTCKYGTVMHWVYYLIAKYNISTQKGGKPNAAICYVLEMLNILRNTRIFLQHGITYNDAEWLYYSNTKMRMFICGAKPEYDYVCDRFGYPEGYVQYLGFSRFDNLVNTPKTNIKKRILVMPTWREWLVLNTQMREEVNYTGDFTDSPYYKAWKELLDNQQLQKLLEENDIELLFYPHRNMQPYLSFFETKNSNVKIASWKEYDIQDLIINSDLMITDYSSVLFDYAYLKKPIIFYQFDYEDFRKGQYREGYFDFSTQKIGEVCESLSEVIDSVKENINNEFVIDEESKQYIEQFFVLNDNKNSERIFAAIKEL